MLRYGMFIYVIMNSCICVCVCIHIYIYLLPASTYYYWAPRNNQVLGGRVGNPSEIRVCRFWVVLSKLAKNRLGSRFIAGMASRLVGAI